MDLHNELADARGELAAAYDAECRASLYRDPYLPRYTKRTEEAQARLLALLDKATRKCSCPDCGVWHEVREDSVGESGWNACPDCLESAHQAFVAKHGF